MPFDIMSGFQVGQQLAGKNALGIMAENVLSRVNSLQQVQVQARGAGLAETERLHALSQFYGSPEGEQLRSGALGMFGWGTAPQALAVPPASASLPSSGSQQAGSTGSIDIGSYTPQYQRMPEVTIDPTTGFPRTTMRLQETPESQKRGAVYEEILKKQQEKEFSTQVVQQQLSVVKKALNRITPVSAQTPGAPVLASAKGIIGRLQGTTSPEFAEAFSTLSSAVPKLINAVGAIPGSRLNPNELKLMGALIMQLPYLSDVERARRYDVIDAMLGKAGVGMGVNQLLPSSPFQPVQSSQPFVQDLLAEKARRQRTRGY